MIRRRTITSYEWHVATGNETVVLLDCVKSFFRRLELLGGTEQLTTTGKNLFDKSKAVTGRINPDNGVLLPETSYTASDYIEVQEGETYFQTGSKESYYRAFYDADKKFTSIPLKGSFQITVPVGSKFLRVSGKEDINNWQIEKGAKSTPYEPYTGLKSSPSPEYPQEIKSAGKWNEGAQKYEVDIEISGNFFDVTKVKTKTNLINNGDGSLHVINKNVIESELFGKLCPDLKVGETCVMRLESTGLSYISINGMVWDTGQAKTITQNILDSTVYFYGKDGSTVVIKNIRITRNTGKNMEYTPYRKPQHLTLTSDRPITKWDRLVEQGGEIGWLYGSAIKTFESDVFKLYADNDKAIQYQVPFEQITNSWEESVCYCNTFENVIGQTIYTQSGKTYFYMGCVHKSMVFSAKNKQGIFASIETFQEWIRNSGTYVWYKTDNKKFVPLSQEEQTQLRNLHSYNGTTHIMVDSGEIPCGINVEYKTKS